MGIQSPEKIIQNFFLQPTKSDLFDWGLEAAAANAAQLNSLTERMKNILNWCKCSSNALNSKGDFLVNMHRPRHILMSRADRQSNLERSLCTLEVNPFRFF